MEHNEKGSVFPYEQLAYVGGSINISCISYHPPIWYKSGGGLPNNTRLMNNSLILSIYDIDEFNAGSYWCQGDENKKEVEFRNQAIVYVGSEYNNKIRLKHIVM